MRFKKLDLNLSIALDHMIEPRPVSAATERMFMSQSAMSNARMRLRTAPNDLVIHPMPVELPSLRLTVQWHAYRASDQGIIWLRDLLKQAASLIDRN